MRKNYESPLAEIEKFTIADFITTSGNDGGHGGHGTEVDPFAQNEYTGEIEPN